MGIPGKSTERGAWEVVSDISAAVGLPVIFQDSWYIAVHKPPGLLVHCSRIARGIHENLVDKLQEQLGRQVFVVHRLDRGTSGVMVLALSSEAAGRLSAKFEAREVTKRYLTVVRGWVEPPEGVNDRPLRQWPGEPERPARTRYRTLARAELPFPSQNHPSSRYSLLDVHPETGRRQQIRRHFSGLSHPVIGDGSHGDKRQNRFIRERYGLCRMLLMAVEIGFRHPFLDRDLSLVCPPDPPTLVFLRQVFPAAMGLPNFP